MCEHKNVAEVCGEKVCGICYGEALLTEPISHRKPGPAIDLSKGLSGHTEHFEQYTSGATS